ncbi:Uncharacterised protein [Haemophilus aegyptius]|uniref:Uncharacterized protein n=1 Tax=Haemophilus aegyptius TaxID=197575 RepID=A0ABY1VWR0_HAEAE|nr:hypothetical protein A9520_02355 [Haemophilus aegyptius]TMQ43106.1 hypothetical protein AO054_06135 [Haemophilus influenzae biotype aegyptius]SQH37650.1 Uncharacterised protein [Haemophilus aegyptius]VEH53412.1 Uncharacterised protein [Haemophilus aegyptius]
MCVDRDYPVQHEFGFHGKIAGVKAILHPNLLEFVRLTIQHLPHPQGQWLIFIHLAHRFLSIWP